MGAGWFFNIFVLKKVFWGEEEFFWVVDKWG